ncbi:MAG: glycosyltransferase family 4 protein [Bacteroidales bacterium]|nr:glycosyltransferase family 4 protein [Bacteroidales bacterium]
MAKPKVLFLLHMPPPLHGAGIVGQAIHDSALVNGAFECRWINISTSSSIKDVQKWSPGKFFSFLKIYRRFKRTVKSFSPDWAYLTPSPSRAGCMKNNLMVRFLNRKDVKVVMHLHNTGYSARPDKSLHELFDGTRVILLSERLYPDIGHVVSREQVSICPNGIDVPLIPRHDRAGAEPHVLFLSNLLRSKGVEDFLDVASALKSRGLRFKCTMVGAESADYSRKSLEAEIASHSLGDIVSYSGMLVGAEKDRVLSESDILLYPSHDDAFPLVILEAMAASLPVVATNVGGIADEVTDGVTGFVCKAGDVKSLAEAVGRLVEDSALRLSMGKAGHEKYLSVFTAAAFEKRITETLCSIFQIL